MSLRRTAPWDIPATATVTLQQRNGYRQVKYSWHDSEWCYEARWHEHVPGAKLIKCPSWRLDRVHPGKGYGPTAAPRVCQTKVGQNWLPTSTVRYCARQYNQGSATSRELAILKAAHPGSNYRLKG